MIRPMISSMIKSMVGSATSLLTRYFSSLNPIVTAHYEILEPITFTGDFEVEVDFSTTNTTSKILIGDSHTASYYFNMDATFFGVFYAGSQKAFNHSAYTTQDGKLHVVKYSLVGTSMTVYLDGISLGTQTITPYTGSNAFLIGASNSVLTYFDGILANAKFTDNSGPTPVTQTFPLNFKPEESNTEVCLEGTNSITAIRVADELKEKYTLVEDDWIGEELVINGGFDTDTDWATDPNWTISGGVMTSTGNGRVYQSIPYLEGGIGTDVTVSFDIVDYTSAGVVVTCYGGVSNLFTGVGTHTFETTTINSLNLYINNAGVGNLVGSIDNVSVKRILQKG